MRHIFIAALITAAASSAFAQGAPRPPSARISGRVVAAETGRPIRWASVRLVSPAGRQLRASTDAQGRFEFKELSAGAYRLDAAAERYLRMYFGGQPYDAASAVIPKSITVKDGETFDKADLSLPRGSAIEGRVVDEFGDAAPGLAVRVSQVVYGGGRRRLLPVGNPATLLPTDDRGHFRIFGLSPGTYYLSAVSGAFAEQAETGGFAPTYYPGTIDIAGAKPITLALGQELMVSFPLVPARMARISGRVVNAAGEPMPRAPVTLTTSDRQGVSDFNFVRGATEADGTFVFRNVPPGSFTFQAYGAPVASAGNLAASEFGWLPVVVDGEDQSGLVIRVSQGPSLRGRVSVTDLSLPFDAKSAGVRVTAIPVEFDSAPVGGGPPPYSIDEEGRFEVKNMSGRRMILVSVQSREWMLSRILHEGRDITDQPVDFNKGDIGEIEVVLTNRVSSIKGTVVGDDGKTVSEYSVVFFATDPSRWTDRSRFIALARPSQDGSFTVRALPPEEYFAIALPGVSGTEWQDPDYLKQLQERAARFFLGEGEQKAITLRILR